jgi:hypothetical protein
MPGALSQFFILSPRGDSIIFRDLRRDAPKTTTESFYRCVKFWGGKVAEAPPVFNQDHLNYIYVKKNGLYFVFVSRENVSPNFATELLIRLTKVTKDYCGVSTQRQQTQTRQRCSSYEPQQPQLTSCSPAGAERGVRSHQLRPHL